MKVLPWFLRAIWCPKHLMRIFKISFLKSLFTFSWIAPWVSEFKWYEAGEGREVCWKPQTRNLKEIWHSTNQVFCCHPKASISCNKIDLIFPDDYGFKRSLTEVFRHLPSHLSPHCSSGSIFKPLPLTLNGDPIPPSSGLVISKSQPHSAANITCHSSLSTPGGPGWEAEF